MHEALSATPGTMQMGLRAYSQHLEGRGRRKSSRSSLAIVACGCNPRTKEAEAGDRGFEASLLLSIDVRGY